MKATFEVASIEYRRDGTTINLTIGPMPGGEDRLGMKATIELSGCRPINLRPEQLVTLAIHDLPKDSP